MTIKITTANTASGFTATAHFPTLRNAGLDRITTVRFHPTADAAIAAVKIDGRYISNVNYLKNFHS